MRQFLLVPLALISLILAAGAAAYGGDGIVKLSSAAAACKAVGAERFVDCGDGTITDMDTGMVWLKDADCFDLYFITASWEEAIAAAASLSQGTCDLEDGSSPGDWRLPTQAEMEDLIRTARDVFNCGPAESPCVTNDIDSNCYFDGSQSSFENVREGVYWTATGVRPFGMQVSPTVAAFNLGTCGGTRPFKSTGEAKVWPVRKIQAD